MNKANRDKLKALELEQLKERYPSMREEMIPLTDWKDNPDCGVKGITFKSE